MADSNWLYDSVRYVYENSLMRGTDDTRFSPALPTDRGMIAAILWRCAKDKGMDVSIGERTDLSSYEDVSAISAYAVPALRWARGAELMQGKGGGRLAPQATATRAEVAAILQRYIAIGF